MSRKVCTTILVNIVSTIINSLPDRAHTTIKHSPLRSAQRHTLRSHALQGHAGLLQRSVQRQGRRRAQLRFRSERLRTLVGMAFRIERPRSRVGEVFRIAR